MNFYSVIDSIHNAQMQDAYQKALECPGIPENALLLLQKFAIDFGNIKFYKLGPFPQELMSGIHQVMLLLGLEWNDAVGGWILKKDIHG